MEKLHIYNSLTRKIEEFIPVTPGFVGVYVCGPTVYGHSHIGHAKSYISFDVIVRYLRYLGYKVRYVQNITDVGHMVGDVDGGEDKISKQAKLEKLEPMEIVESYTRSYFEDMDRLGLLRPDISPRASGHIIEQIEMITRLIEKGYAYEVKGNVYFDVHKFEGYGKLSGRKIDEMEAGARIEINEEKKHPADFSLWKKADAEHLMQWQSPWGKGYPGWHIECSCMSTKYLGETIDIHGGGLENIFPHHECEIAQSEGTYEKPFAKYWLHNNMVTVDGVKMGKSLGNFTTIKDALKKYSPLAIRFFILMSHYRSTLDFSDDAIQAAEKGYKKLSSTLIRLSESINNAAENQKGNDIETIDFSNSFTSAMNDDFNTPQAMAAVFNYLTEINKRLDDQSNLPGKNNLNAVWELLQKTIGGVLGLISNDFQRDTNDKLDLAMQIILKIRDQLRKERNFKLTDEIRDSFKKAGISIKDSAQGAIWEFD